LSYTLGVGMTIAITSAYAETPKSAADSQSLGIMTFPNVQVVNAPSVDVAPKKQTNTEGLHAYIDRKTGKLRSVSIEERNKAGEEFAARQADKAKRSAARSTDSSAEAVSENSEARTLYGPGGAVGVQLTEDHLVFQVAHKTDSGLVREEVTGKTAAEQALRSGKTAAKQTEVSHER
jgi:hypothetical protein